MSKKPLVGDALDDISAWDTEGVLCLLRKVSERSSLRSAHVAVGRASLRAVRGKSCANRCNFAADADCQRRDATGATSGAQGRGRESETHVHVKGGKYASIFIARLVQGEEDRRGRGVGGLARIPGRFSVDRVEVTDLCRFPFSRSRLLRTPHYI